MPCAPVTRAQPGSQGQVPAGPARRNHCPRGWAPLCPASPPRSSNWPAGLSGNDAQSNARRNRSLNLDITPATPPDLPCESKLSGQCAGLIDRRRAADLAEQG
jgi:hypothetical protein